MLAMSSSAPIPPGSVALRRPHFRLVGNDLFFLISRRPAAQLSDLERQVWEALGDESPVEDLRDRFSQQVDSAIGRLVDLGACEIAAARFPAGRRRVLIIEPHSDDAALSVGGTMWARRRECEFTVASLASRSNFTSYFLLDRDFFNVDEISALRAAEGALAARLVGGRYLGLGRPEATLRYRDGNWTLEWFRKHRVSVSMFIGRHYTDADLADSSIAIRSLLADTDAEEVWIPMGIGLHSDHQLARDACLEAFLQQPALIDGRTIRMYEEVPYAIQNPRYNASLVAALERAGAVLVPERVPIEAVFERKIRIVSIYASQFKVDVMQPEIESCARLAAGTGGMAERLWRIDRLPESLDRASLSIDHELPKARSRRITDWFNRHRHAKRIRMLLLLPSGRWALDAVMLLRSFPCARLDVYVTTVGAAEVSEVESPRIHVYPVDTGAKAWGRLALRLALTRPAPTVFIAGKKRLGAARALATLWPRSDAIVLASLDHFLAGAGTSAGASRDE